MTVFRLCAEKVKPIFNRKSESLPTEQKTGTEAEQIYRHEWRQLFPGMISRKTRNEASAKRGAADISFCRQESTKAPWFLLPASSQRRFLPVSSKRKLSAYPVS